MNRILNPTTIESKKEDIAAEQLLNRQFLFTRDKENFYIKYKDKLIPLGGRCKQNYLEAGDNIEILRDEENLENDTAEVIHLLDDIDINTCNLSPDGDNTFNWKGTVKLGELNDNNALFMLTKQTEVDADVQGIIGGEVLIKIISDDDTIHYAHYAVTCTSTGSWSLAGAGNSPTNVRMCKMKQKSSGDYYYGLKLPLGQFENFGIVERYVTEQRTGSINTFLKLGTRENPSIYLSTVDGTFEEDNNNIALTAVGSPTLVENTTDVYEQDYTVSVKDLLDSFEWGTELTTYDTLDTCYWKDWYRNDSLINLHILSQDYKNLAGEVIGKNLKITSLTIDNQDIIGTFDGGSTTVFDSDYTDYSEFSAKNTKPLYGSSWSDYATLLYTDWDETSTTVTIQNYTWDFTDSPNEEVSGGTWNLAYNRSYWRSKSSPDYYYSNDSHNETYSFLYAYLRTNTQVHFYTRVAGYSENADIMNGTHTLSSSSNGVAVTNGGVISYISFNQEDVKGYIRYQVIPKGTVTYRIYKILTSTSGFNARGLGELVDEITLTDNGTTQTLNFSGIEAGEYYLYQSGTSTYVSVLYGWNSSGQLWEEDADNSGYNYSNYLSLATSESTTWNTGTLAGDSGYIQLNTVNDFSNPAMSLNVYGSCTVTVGFARQGNVNSANLRLTETLDTESSLWSKSVSQDSYSNTSITEVTYTYTGEEPAVIYLLNETNPINVFYASITYTEEALETNEELESMKTSSEYYTYSFNANFGRNYEIITDTILEETTFTDNFTAKHAEFWFNGWNEIPESLKLTDYVDSDFEYQVLSNKSDDNDSFAETFYTDSNEAIDKIEELQLTGEDNAPYKIIISGTISRTQLDKIAELVKNPERQIWLDMSGAVVDSTAEEWNDPIFINCVSLRGLVVPQGIKEMQSVPFMWCTYMRSLDLRPSADTLTAIGGTTWGMSCGLLTSTRVRTLMVPRSVSNFGAYLVYSSNISNLILLHQEGDQKIALAYNTWVGTSPSGSTEDTLPNDFRIFVESGYEATILNPDSQWASFWTPWTSSGQSTKAWDSITVFDKDWTQEEWQEFENKYYWGEELINEVRAEFGKTDTVEIKEALS